MNLNILFFLLSYFLIILSCVGYGVFISNKLSSHLKINCLGFKGLIGIFFLIIYSYISHFFIPHSLLHNSILILLVFYFLFIT